MNQAQYDKMTERWIDFLNEQPVLWVPVDEEDLSNNYDGLAEEFCKKHRYSKKTLEFAFHGQWWDTFADEYYQILERKGWNGFDRKEGEAKDESR